MPQRRDLLKLAGLSPALFFGAAGSPLPNAVFSVKNAKLTKEPFGELLIYFDGPTDQLRQMTAGSLRLRPGASPHPPHQHPEEEFLLVTEGTGQIELEGKITPVGPGAMMYCAGGKLHGIVNTGKSALLFYFYKWLR
jgi:quercetin dioxygenase-like cupin family protein